MNTRLLTWAAVAVMLALVVPQAGAICVPNPDWPDAPCYAPFPGDYASHMKKVKQDWEKYYDFKGPEFMEQKKTEMLSAFNNGTLNEWRMDGNANEHSNVIWYYYLQGEIPDEDGEYVDEKIFRKTMQYYSDNLAEGMVPIGGIYVSVYLFVIIVVVTVASIVIVRRKRK